MKDIQFKIVLKSGKQPTALAFIKAFDKRFNGYRFIWSTGLEVNRKTFKAATPGKALKNLLKTAETAVRSLQDEDLTLTNGTLKQRIELLVQKIHWNENEISIWTGEKAVSHPIPDGVDKESLTEALYTELLKSRPDLQRVINNFLSEGTNELFGFWQGVLDGNIDPRHGKKLRPSTLSDKRQTLRLVKEYDCKATFARMDMAFYNGFKLWLAKQKIKTGKRKGEPRFDQNTIGKHFKAIKSILHLANKNDILTHDKFKYWTVTKESNEVVTLTKDELLAINAMDLSGTLNDVRDIFVLACFLGARISDFKSFVTDNITTEDGISYFKYVQEKTGAVVRIPIRPIAQKILAKRGGEFPKMISEQNFRAHLKTICEKAKLNDRVIIRIRNGVPEYEVKYKAITPHSARRTFASNLVYGWFDKPMPARLAMRYTGHKKEKSFLAYIGADEKELDILALQYFNLEPELKVA